MKKHSVLRPGKYCKENKMNVRLIKKIKEIRIEIKNQRKKEKTSERHIKNKNV